MDGLHFVSFGPNYSILHHTNILTAIHGDKQQNERDWVLNEFKTGKSPIMVATDVASRGIGMIENPFPYKAMPSRLNCSALLSTLRRFLACVTLLGLCRVLRFSIMENLGSVVRHLSCFTRNSVLRVSSGYRGGIGIS